MSFSESMQVIELCNQPSSKLSQQLLTQEIQSFDYAALTPKCRSFLQSKTSEIKSLMRRSAEDIVDIGQKLIEVKEQLGHGNFRAWLKAEFDWSARTAARFMQVTTQFKCANLAHLNIAVSALYLLAEPSSPEKARKEALELAKKGENVTHTKAKVIVGHYQELAQSDALNPANINISAQATEGNSFPTSEPCRSPQTHYQLEPKDEANSVATGVSVEAVPTIEWDKKLEQKAVEKIDWLSRDYSKAAAELQSELSNHIRILCIERKNPEVVTNIAQTFELTFAGARVDFEGYPEALIILFEQMQKNPAFTEEVLQQARLLAANTIKLDGVA